ncbi:hypothetical protein [Flavobacterium sp. MK4S-17]|uniref:hypothetical protein n=1 Tax=Flavobacterium sp. MK4S-17 TaxID=2543737 RepID=UPI0013592568|nr:hypothetical protein [Flavobacterium sp. MK4S-17]
MKKLLPAFAYLFHPILIPVYATLFYFIITRNFFYNHEIYLVILQVLTLTVLLPGSLYYLLRSLGIIQTIKLNSNKERRLPLACYAVLLMLLLRHGLATFVIPELYYYILGVFISILMALLLVLFNYRASLHVMGVVSLTLFIISISAYYHVNFLNLIAFFVVCSGLVASGRLYTKSNSLGEIILGALIATLPQLLLWFIWLVPVF